MPAGRVHAGTSTLTAIAIAASALTPEINGFTAFYASLGCLSGVLLSPDLDVDGGYIGLRLAGIFFGSIFKWIWKWIWKPYAILVPHRSPISHTPVIGTTLRLLYLYAAYLILGTVLFYATGWPHTVYIIPVKDAVVVLLNGRATLAVKAGAMGFVGLCISDALHALMDVLSTKFKKLSFRRRRTWQFTLSDVGNAAKWFPSNTR